MTEEKLSIESAMRERMASHLRDAFDVALNSYHHFYFDPECKDTKAFTAHHAGCKAALAHLQTLIKLAAWVEHKEGDGDDEDLTEMRDLANKELEKMQEDERE